MIVKPRDVEHRAPRWKGRVGLSEPRKEPEGRAEGCGQAGTARTEDRLQVLLEQATDTDKSYILVSIKP